MSPKFAISSLVASAIIGAAALTAPSAGAADTSESPVTAYKVGNQCEVDIDETHLIKDISEVFAVSLTYSPIKDSLNQWLENNSLLPLGDDVLTPQDDNFQFNFRVDGQAKVRNLSTILKDDHKDMSVGDGFTGGAILIASGGLATKLNYPLWEHKDDNSANGTDLFDKDIRPIDRAAIQLNLGSVVDANGQPVISAIEEQKQVIDHLQHLYSYYLIKMFTDAGRDSEKLVTSEFLPVFEKFENRPAKQFLINNFLEKQGLVDSYGHPTMEHVVAACQEAFGVTPTSTTTSTSAAPTSTSTTAPSTTSTKTTTSTTSTTNGPVSSWVNPNQPTSTTSKTTSTTSKSSTTSTTAKSSTTSTSAEPSTTSQQSTSEKTSTTSTSAKPSTTTTTSKASTTSQQSTSEKTTTTTSKASTTSQQSTSEKSTTSTSTTTSKDETTSTTAGSFEPEVTSVTDPTSTTTTGNNGSGSGNSGSGAGAESSTTTANPGETSKVAETSGANNGGSTTTTTTPATSTSNRESGNGGSNVVYNTTSQTTVPSEGVENNGRWGSSGNKVEQEGSGSSGSSADTLPMIAALAVIFGLGGIFAFFYSFLHNSGVSLTFLR